MTSSVGVITFPGSLDDSDSRRALAAAGMSAIPLWHGSDSLADVDAVLVPGGFSYGDYLRCGAIARFAPLMTEVIAAAGRGMPVIGICNGFQILCESHLLPGALTRNESLHYICRDQWLRVENNRTAWTADYDLEQEILIPVKHGEGRYVADDHTLDELEDDGRVVVRYIGGNPNGSFRDIAGICNDSGNVVGLMPHPEHAIDPLTGAPGVDGQGFFTSVVKALVGSGSAR